MTDAVSSLPNAAAGPDQAESQPGLDLASIGGLPRARARSPLEQSPGYYPPADPESTSVLTGRRNAKAVDLPFTGGAASREELARMVLTTLSARDLGALHRLRVDKQEFGTILWPEFPQSRPITHITLDDAWFFNLSQSAGGGQHAMDEYGGRDLALIRVDCDPGFPYRNFTLYRNFVILAKDLRTNDVFHLRFMPSIVERRGRYKALTYRD